MCEVGLELDWDRLREKVISSSLPSLPAVVRVSVVWYLSNSEDTVYGISKSLKYPIQSVYKALNALTGKYVVCEYGLSKKRRNVEAKICRLTDLGRLAVMVLRAPNIDTELVVSELRKLPAFRSSPLDEVFRCRFLREAFSYYLLRNLSIMFVEDFYDRMVELAKLASGVVGAPLTVLSVPLSQAYTNLLEDVSLALLDTVLDEAHKLFDRDTLSFLEKLIVTPAVDFSSDPYVQRIREVVKNDSEVRKVARKVFEEYAYHERNKCVVNLTRIFVGKLLLGGMDESAVAMINKIIEDLGETRDVLATMREEVLKRLRRGS